MYERGERAYGRDIVRLLNHLRGKQSRGLDRRGVGLEKRVAVFGKLCRNHPTRGGGGPVLPPFLVERRRASWASYRLAGGAPSGAS